MTKKILLLFFLILLGIICYTTLRLSKDGITSINNTISYIRGGKNTNSQIKHVFVIVEENHDWQDITGNTDAPYINKTLTKQGAYASNYHNVPISLGNLHPSELNYIFMQAGTVTFPDHTFTTDDMPYTENTTASKNHLTYLLDYKNLTWKSYQEGISGNDCPTDSSGDYSPRHNPVIYFQDVSGNPASGTNEYCKNHVRPLSELATDLQNGTVPNYVFITPSLQNDMHDGTITQADIWLSQIVPEITNSSTFKKDGALFITWDEGSENNGSNNPIGMIMLSPFIKPGYTNTTEYSHASFLKTVEEIFHLTPLLGLAADPKTKDLLDFFTFH